jgi:riboflavin biosynthesis pyrimidine reductase
MPEQTIPEPSAKPVNPLAGYFRQPKLYLKLPSNGEFYPEALMDSLKKLRNFGIHSILVEGGANTYAPLVRAGKVQRLHAYLAPTLLGGRHGLGWSSGFGGAEMLEQIRLRNSRRKIVGDDLYWTATLQYP